MVRHGYSTENTKDVTRREEGVGIALGHAVMWVVGLSLQSAAHVPTTLQHMGKKILELSSMQANQSQKWPNMYDLFR